MIDSLMKIRNERYEKELAKKDRELAERDRRAERTAISAIRRERARNTPDSEIAVIIAEDYEFPDDKVRELMARA